MKGNMFLGYARGSVGDVTFSRTKGQQTARARNRKPNNPRTSAQMRQRTLFIDAVKFFSRGNQNFFTFAFEDKRPAESDYNAFMRYNSNRGIRLKKEDFEFERYPAVGEWIMTRGSLTGIISTTYTSTNYTALLRATAPSSAPTTVGALSTALITNGAWQAGDIITMVEIITDATANSAVQPVGAGAETPQWIITQFELDPESTTTLASYGLAASSSSGLIALTHAEPTEDIAAWCIVQSRKTAEGLKVGNSNLVNNAAAAQAVTYGKTLQWTNIVLADWQAREEAVLEGGATPSNS